MGWKLYLFTFLLGFISFPAATIAFVVYYFKLREESLNAENKDENDMKQPLLKSQNAHYSTKEKSRDPGSSAFAGAKNDDLLWFKVDPDLKAGAVSEKKGVDVFKKGEIVITKQCFYHPMTIPEDKRDTPEYPTMAKLQRNKNKYYCVLKHGNLFLYEDENHEGLTNAIVLKDTIVTIWPNNETIGENALFTKRTCIAIFKNRLYNRDTKQIELPSLSAPSNLMFFCYFDDNSVKEDWYFALLDASKSNAPSASSSSFNTTCPEMKPPITAHFKTKDMLKLVQIINSTEGQLSTKWLNVILGRLFLSFKENEKMSNIIKNKIYTKLSKINTPGYFDGFKIIHLYPGDVAPIFTNPKTRQISIEGDCEVSVDVAYAGNLVVQMSAILSVPMGFKKPKNLPVDVKLILKKLNGTLVFKMKKPPSNRIWYCFEHDPEMDMDIEPLVSNRNFNYNMITGLMKSKIQDALKESLVFPFMDDIVYYTLDEYQDYFYKGGVWDFSENVVSNEQDGNSDPSKEDNKPTRQSLEAERTLVDGLQSKHQEEEKKKKEEKQIKPLQKHNNNSNEQNTPKLKEPFSAKLSSSDEALDSSSLAKTPGPPVSKINSDDSESASYISRTSKESKIDDLKEKTKEKVDNFKNFFKNVDQKTDSATDENSANKYSKKLSKWYSNVKDSASSNGNDFARTPQNPFLNKGSMTSPLQRKAEDSVEEPDSSVESTAVNAATSAANAQNATKTESQDEAAPYKAPEMITSRRVKRNSVVVNEVPKTPESDVNFENSVGSSVPAGMFVKKDVLLTSAKLSPPGNHISGNVARTKTVKLNGHEKEFITSHRPVPPDLPPRN
ncbi:hypothetical protein ACO0QE_003175 [Hanseniaspora vineae]